jgi:putative membrane protein
VGRVSEDEQYNIGVLEAVMTGLLLRWIGNSLAILFIDWVFDGVSVASTQDAFIAGAVLGVINTIVKPVLVVLTLPATILTLGLFYFVITAFCLWLTGYLLDGFSVHGVITTLVAALLVSLVSTIVTSALQGKKEVRRS